MSRSSLDGLPSARHSVTCARHTEVQALRVLSSENWEEKLLPFQPHSCSLYAWYPSTHKMQYKCHYSGMKRCPIQISVDGTDGLMDPPVTSNTFVEMKPTSDYSKLFGRRWRSRTWLYWNQNANRLRQQHKFMDMKMYASTSRVVVSAGRYMLIYLFARLYPMIAKSLHTMCPERTLRAVIRATD